MPEHVMLPIIATAFLVAVLVAIWRATRDWQPINPTTLPPVNVDAILGTGPRLPETEMERTDRILSAVSDIRYSLDCDRAQTLLPERHRHSGRSVVDTAEALSESGLVQRITRVRVQRDRAVAAGRHRAPGGQAGHVGGAPLSTGGGTR